MNPAHDTDAYVHQALALAGFSLEKEEAERVALEFARIAQIASTLFSDPLSLHDEPLPVYRP